MKDRGIFYLLMLVIIASIISIISGICKDSTIRRLEREVIFHSQISEIREERLEIQSAIIDKQDSIINQLFDRLAINQLKQ